MTGERLQYIVRQYEFGVERLTRRLAGPDVDSGDDQPVTVPPMTDREYLWEPVDGCWSVRRKVDGPGAGATVLVGAGEWGRDGGRPHPYPPPFTTIAWRLSHLSDMLAMRADWTIGSHAMQQDDYVNTGAAAEAIEGFSTAAQLWHSALVEAGETGLDTVGFSQYPNGSDPDEPFVETALWVTQEVLHHGAEIALLRDLYRDRHRV